MGVNLQLSTLPRDKTDALLLVFTCTIVLLPFTAHSPLWVNSIAGLLIAWRVLITLRGHALPPKWLLIIITAALLGGAVLYFHTWIGKEIGIALLIVLACLKMLEMHARRDALAVIFVCYFLLVGQLLYSQSLLTALYMLLCISLLLSTQLAFQYHQLTPSLSKRLSGGFTMVGMAIPLALILFLLFPRPQGPLWGKQQNRPVGITGLSDTMEPGNVVDLARSEQIAFRVKFPGVIPPAPQLYWRAIVLDTYNGKRWSASPTRQGQETAQEPTVPPPGVSVTQEIILEPHNQRWLFGLDRPVSIDSATILIQGSSGIVSHLTNNWEMISNDVIADRIRYSITSHLSNSAIKTISTPLSAAGQLELENKFLQLPAGYNPLTRQWSEQLHQKLADPLQFTQSVLNFFRQQPFRYTMSPPPLANDQVDDFMFNTQAGFCEHYASTFAVIMRAAGIPARIVLGYQGGEINPIDGLMTIRQADAHAWVEIWIEEKGKARGWLRIDPTAAVSPDRIDRGLNGSFPDRNFADLIDFSQQTWLSNLAKEVRLRWDAANSAWNLWVLNYNLNKQKDLLRTLVGIERPQPAQVGIAMMIAASVVIAVFSLILLRKKNSQNPLDKLYADFCQYMGSLGYPRLPYEGPNDYSQRLRPAFQQSPELNEFLSLYTKFKYGKGYNSGLYKNPAVELIPTSTQLAALKALLKLCLQLKPLNT